MPKAEVPSQADLVRHAFFYEEPLMGISGDGPHLYAADSAMWHTAPAPLPPGTVEDRYARLSSENMSPAYPPPAPGFCYCHDYGAQWGRRLRLEPIGSTPGESRLFFTPWKTVSGDRSQVRYYATALGLASAGPICGAGWNVDAVPCALTPRAVAWWADYVLAFATHSSDPFTDQNAPLPEITLAEALQACRAVALRTRAPTARRLATPFPLRTGVMDAELRAHLQYFMLAPEPVRMLTSHEVHDLVVTEVSAQIGSWYFGLPDSQQPRQTAGAGASPAVVLTRPLDGSSGTASTAGPDYDAVLAKFSSNDVGDRLVRSLLDPTGPRAPRPVAEVMLDAYGRIAPGNPSGDAWRQMQSTTRKRLRAASGETLSIEYDRAAQMLRIVSHAVSSGVSFGHAA